MVFLWVVIGIVVIGVRAHRDKHFQAIAREGDIACPVSATSQTATGRDIRNNSLRSAASLQVPIAVREAHHRTCIRNVNVFWIRARRIKSNTEGLRQSRGEYFHGPRLAIGADAAQYPDAPRFAFRHEQIAVRRAPDQPRILQTGDISRYGKSRQGLRPGIRGLRHDVRAVVRRLRAIRFRQVR